MKKALLILCALFLFSCSQDEDCSSQKKEIKEYYENEIQKVYDNTQNGETVDNRKINLIKEERDRKLAEACD